MNDYWNDPPEAPDAPMCCDDEMAEDAAGYVCTHCGAMYSPAVEPPDPPMVDDFDCTPAETPTHCRHGRLHADGCDACDHESDLAFDAMRESRHRGFR